MGRGSNKIPNSQIFFFFFFEQWRRNLIGRFQLTYLFKRSFLFLSLAGTFIANCTILSGTSSKFKGYNGKNVLGKGIQLVRETIINFIKYFICILGLNIMLFK